MHKIRKKIISLLVLIAVLGVNFINIANINADFTEYRNVDKRTFNEYRYKLTKEFLIFEQKYEINNKVIDKSIARRILALVKTGYRYLPDDLVNESLKLKLITSIQKGIANPEDEYNYADIKTGLKSFIQNAKIKAMSGKIDATPSEGNAPLVTTLRANIIDPSGVKIPKSAYVWWMDYGNGRRGVLGTGPFLSKRFTEEGNFTIFLDVRSSHKNKYGNSDILPYSGKVQIKVQEKIASIVMRISGKNVPENDEIKFSPEVARYGLIFDATSSIPASGTRFIETYWDFGNGVQKKYSGRPRMERVVYTKEGDYDVTLKLKTNRGRVVDKKFKVFVHNPVAVISASSTEGYMGDNFTFSTKVHGGQKNLTFLWEIYDVDREKIVLQKAGKKLDYSFKNKGRFSVRLKITDNVGNIGIDTKTIYINSQKPVPNFTSKILLSNKPNQVYFDATSTFDPDNGDDGHLRYYWTIDGMKVNLENSNDNNSTGYYTFDSIGEHSVILEVEDPDGITASKKGNVKINSLLSLDFLPAPRVIQRNKKIRFLANSKFARFYEWDFGDGEKKSLESNKVSHAYSESGIYKVTLKVRGTNNDSNTLTKVVYIGDSKNPVAVLDIGRGQGGFKFKKEVGACNGKDAHIISRVDSIHLSSKESIDTNGKASGLSVSWKIGDKFIDKPNVTYKFDELGCFKIKLTVKSKKDKTSDSAETWVKVVNLKPTLLQLKVDPIDINTDPVVVKVKTVGAKDKDGIIKSYLWYYTTDLDSSPQDFKITMKGNTSFVVPKIPGNYHFGVILKDNNDAKVNSDDLIGKNTLMLSGDNTNTPLIDFKVSKTSAAIGDNINFTAIATNVLGRSIEKDSKFSWDFDGDGFYEKQTDTGRISYKYNKSGTFYAKVKVSHKGYSNTRTVTINVVNKLVANFDYISIGNKYVFIDRSKGAIDNYKWDLGDGNLSQNKKKFVYKYDDNRPIHNVELTVAEGTKIKKTKKLVKKDLRNVLKTRKQGINVFTFPPMNSNNTIVLDQEDSVFVYLGESKGVFVNYGIDYDINVDSDLNGGKDDDRDNEHNLSFTRGDPDEITLNKSRIQTVRLFLLDKDGNTVDSKDITIEKTYIKEEKIPEVGKFEGVSEEIKIKFENLKSIIKTMPQEHRMRGMKYLQKLKDNWEDETERTRTIMDFEGFIDGTGVENVDEIIELLESLIITEGDDNGEKAIAFAALKALIPKDIECKTSGESCKEFLVSKLEKINKSNDVEVNRQIGKEILKVGIIPTKLMNKKQKNDFRAILKVLVYSSQSKIPTEEVSEVEAGDIESGKNIPTKVEPVVPEQEKEEDGKLMGFLKNIGTWALWILGILFLGMFVFWILDFLKNRKSGESFEDFVDNKTGDDDILGDVLSDEETKDPLAGGTEQKKSGVFSEEKVPTKVVEKKVAEEPVSDPLSNTQEAKVPDWLSGSTNNEEIKSEPKKEEVFVPKIEEQTEEKNENKEASLEEENVGFSLSAGEENSNEKEDNLEEETKIEEVETPDWLKDSVTDKLPKKKEIKEDEFLEENNSDEVVVEDEVEPTIIEDKPEEKIDLENDFPDWLKPGNEDETSTNEEIKLESESENENESLKEVKSDKEVVENEIESEPEIKSSDDNIPDWLKGSIEEQANEEKEEIKKEAKKEVKETKLDEVDVPDWLKDSVKESNINIEETSKSKKEDNKEDKKTSNGEDKKVTKDEKKEDLYDGEVDVPDWLKD